MPKSNGRPKNRQPKHMKVVTPSGIPVTTCLFYRDKKTGEVARRKDLIVGRLISAQRS